MAVVNPMNPVLHPNVKDSRWLTLEVCREYQRNKCTRTENECKFAHPPAHVEVQNGRVIACFDSIKGKCQRKDPPCKYLHPPQHLREQLLQNGRNNLILRSLQMQTYHPQMIAPSIIPMAGGKAAMAYPTAVVQGQMPYVTAAVPQSRPAHVSHPAFVSYASSSSATSPDVFGLPLGRPPSTVPCRMILDRESWADSCQYQTPHYLSAMPTSAVAQLSPYGMPTAMATVQSGTAADGTIVTTQIPSVITTTVPTKAPVRPDRLEIAHCISDCAGEACCEPPMSEPSYLPPASQPSYVIPPYKRLAVEGGKGAGGLPTVYQPTLSASAAAAYQQAALMQLQQQQQQQSYPLTYSSDMMSAAYTNYLPQVAGHPPTVPRF